MEGIERVVDKATTDRNSASSTNKLIQNNDNNQFTESAPTTATKKAKEKPQKIKQEPETPPQSPADRPSFRGPFGISPASTIIWYLCICVLFVIAFFALAVSALYFITDTVSEKVIKLYGLSGSGALALVTFLIIFLDCFYDGGKKDHEEEVLYNTMKEKEAQERAMAIRRARRIIAEEKEAKSKPFTIQHKRPSSKEFTDSQPHPHPYQHHHSHHLHHLPFHLHQAHASAFFHHPFVCPVCHDLHASGNARHNLTDVAVDTSDKFAPVPKNKTTVHKSTRDSQTEPKLWDAERGTQTDRTSGTQTSAMELSGLPGNITQIIHETTILKAPRNLLPTLKKSMAQQDMDVALSRAVADTNTITAAIV